MEVIMRLGIIGCYHRADFEAAKARGLSALEFDVNVNGDVGSFLSAVSEIKTSVAETGVTVSAVGRWGANRILPDGSADAGELATEKKLIAAAEEVGCPVYITGCNYQKSLTYADNCAAAAAYLGQLLSYAGAHHVKICTYNCDWNNFVYDSRAWTSIHGNLPDLGIKYDPSHCVYRGGDYLQEAAEWGGRFYHVHIKGSLVIGGKRFDDPPAGMDMTNWGAFLSVLYAHRYEGVLSIEPHSANWSGDLGEKGIDFTIHYMRQLLL